MNKKGQPLNQMTGAMLRGGVDIDESILDDNAVYWREGAKSANEEIEKYVGCEHLIIHNCRTWKIEHHFWYHKNSWKTICLKTERMLHLIKLLVKESK